MTLINKTKSLGFVRIANVVLAAVVLAGLAYAGVSFASSGAVWTTPTTCGPNQNVNQYTVGESVWINGSGFATSTSLPWIIKEPGQNGATIASGNAMTDVNGDVCINALLLTNDHVGGPYQAQFDDKNDNFSVVAGAAPTTGTLVVIKTVTNDNGGTSTPSNFTLNVTGPSSFSQSAAGSATGVSYSNLTPGTYTVTEDAYSGYTANFASCGTSGSVTVTAGATSTCTVVNNDNIPTTPTQGTLTVTKVVINDSGSGVSTTSDFTLRVFGNGATTTVTSGVSQAFATGTYQVSEIGPGGYTPSFSGDCDTNGNVTVVAGQSASCTLTNNDIPRTGDELGSITIRKEANPEDGTDFAFTFGESAFTLDDEGATNTDDGFIQQTTFNGLVAGTYNVNETLPSGWSVTNVTCDAEGVLAHDSGETDSQITIGAGQDVTCTYTNTKDSQPGDDDDDNSGDDDDDNGGGSSHRHSNGGGNNNDDGEVLGAQTTVIPAGAPNTGFGGMAAEGANALASIFTLAGTAALFVGKKKF